VLLGEIAIGGSPASATPEGADPAAARERIVIHGVGDILLCHCFHRAFVTEGYEHAFSGMQGLFTRDALTVGNLECAPGNGGRMLDDKPFAMRCDTGGYPAMAAAGMDVVSLANNHAGDAGMRALLRGIGDLRGAGITPVGAGAHRAEAIRPAVFLRGGWSIAVVGFTAVGGGQGWPAGLPRDPGTAWAEPAVMERVMRSLDESFDLVIVTIHQGAGNYSPTPSPREVATGHALIDAGADVVMAHHHHRVLPMVIYPDRPIFWGLGDFVWSRFGDHRDVSAVAEVVVEEDGSITGRLIPAYIVTHGHPVLRGLPDPAMRWQPPPFH
jgi:poly-gamma-glutamate synthesis protein (capsule biosynthesis protein)